MEDAKVTVEELEKVLSEDIHRLAKEIAEAMNLAQPGRIIADSEEPVRDAHAEFRQRAYQKALSLLQDKQGAFSPSADRTEEQGTPQRHAPDDQRASSD